jgi:hypothetical protein
MTSISDEELDLCNTCVKNINCKFFKTTGNYLDVREMKWAG